MKTLTIENIRESLTKHGYSHSSIDVILAPFTPYVPEIGEVYAYDTSTSWGYRKNDGDISASDRIVRRPLTANEARNHT